MKLYDFNGKLVENPPKVIYRGMDWYKDKRYFLIQLEELFEQGEIPSKALLLQEGKLDLNRCKRNCSDITQDKLDYFLSLLNKDHIDPNDIDHELNICQNLFYPTHLVSVSDHPTIGAKYSGWTSSEGFRKRPILSFKSDDLEGVDFRKETDYADASFDREIGIYKSIPIDNLIEIITSEKHLDELWELLKKYNRNDVQLIKAEIKKEFLPELEGDNIFYPKQFDNLTKEYNFPNIIGTKEVMFC